MNHRQLPASFLRNGQLTWVQLFVVGVVVVATGHVAQAVDGPLNVVTVDTDPMAELSTKPDDSSQYLPGTGLCAAYRTTMAPGDYFPGRTSLYPGSVYDGTEPFSPAVDRFMDNKVGAGNSGPVVYQSMQTPFDLAAYPALGLNTDGDFIKTRACEPYFAGCAFPGSGPPTMVLPQFGSRYRGFFGVTPNLVGQVIYFGFTTNSAVALRVWSKVPPSGTVKIHEIISRPPALGQADFRVANGIRFAKAGLYPIEIQHVSANNAARLEMAMTTMPFNPLEELSGAGSMTLGSRGAFQLATPERFFQRLDGALAFPGKPAECQQCAREYANSPTQPRNGSICPACMTCNEAAVCQICNTSAGCGCECQPCSGTTPICAGDPTKPQLLHCVQCEKDEQCNTGQSCIDNKCVGFCPCCDSPLKCTTTDESKPDAKNCSECARDSDCPDNGVCDRINGRCVAKLPEHGDDRDCGLNSVNCIESTKNERSPRPYCLNAEVCVQCRFSSDCARGSYCRSGDCIPCTDDRHCGPSCNSCGVSYAIAADGTVVSSTTTDTPVCYAPSSSSDQPAPPPSCVECLTDSHCGSGGSCDPASHKCISRAECSVSCPADQICSGGGCVECITSSQCRCGQCAAGVCTKSCGDSTDCLGNQCCSQETATCKSGRCKPSLTAHGGALCCDATAGAVGGGEDPAAPVRSQAALWTMLAALGLLIALRLRALRAEHRVAGRRGRE